LRLPRRQRAFTLLEVLMVLLIIGIATGFAVLAVSGRSIDDRVSLEGHRLEQLIRLASDTAVLDSRQIGLIVGRHDYRFVFLHDGKWLEFPPDQPLRPRNLPAPLIAALHTDGLELSDDQRKALGKDTHPPQVLILSSGEMTPFRLEVTAPGADTGYRIDADLLGQIKMTRIEPDNA
jgi:general secretion pathway protein H